MFAEEELLPISALQHLLFCERRAALVCLEGLWEDNIFTVEGSILHEKTHQAETESRSDLRIARGLWLRSLRLGLSGKADVVEFYHIKDELENGIELPGVSGLWQPYPVEFKRGRLRSEVSYEVQLCAQGMCLEEMLGVEINSGALYYGKTHRRLEIPLDTNLRRKTESAITRLREIIESGVTPAAQRNPRCKACSMSEICLPKLNDSKRKVSDYLRRTLTSMEEIS